MYIDHVLSIHCSGRHPQRSHPEASRNAPQAAAHLSSSCAPLAPCHPESCQSSRQLVRTSVWQAVRRICACRGPGASAWRPPPRRCCARLAPPGPRNPTPQPSARSPRRPLLLVCTAPPLWWRQQAGRAARRRLRQSRSSSRPAAQWEVSRRRRARGRCSCFPTPARCWRCWAAGPGRPPRTVPSPCGTWRCAHWQSFTYDTSVLLACGCLTALQEQRPLGIICRSSTPPCV